MTKGQLVFVIVIAFLGMAVGYMLPHSGGLSAVGVQSPYIGAWVRNDGGDEIRLHGDGSGVFSGSWGAAKEFKWQEEGDHIVFNDWTGSQKYIGATISSDGQSLTIIDTRGGNWACNKKSD